MHTRTTMDGVDQLATETGLLVQRVVYAGLDALGSVLALDLCACVHLSDGFGPQLYLRAPDLQDLDPSDAFTLFTALRDLLEEATPAAGSVNIAGYTGVAQFTAGPRSRSLSVAGRRVGTFDPHEEQVALALCRALGTATHALEEANDADAILGSIRIGVEVADGLARAEVSVPTGATRSSGHGEAASSTVAVAQAALAAVDPGLRLGSATDDEIDGERAVLVLVRDGDGRAALGAAICGRDPLHATACAAIEAATRLR